MEKDSRAPGLVACALAREAGFLSGFSPNVQVFGPGKFFAGAFHSILAGHPKPSWALLAGFSGSLQPDLAPGDLILARWVQSPEGQVFASPLAEFLAQGPPDLNFRTGTVYHSDDLVDDPAKKEALGARGPNSPLAVDMESAAFAGICDSLGVPWGILRVIFDRVSDPLPPGMGDWCRPDGKENIWRIATQLLMAPSWWAKIPTWMKASKACGEKLAKGMEFSVAKLLERDRTTKPTIP